MKVQLSVSEFFQDLVRPEIFAIGFFAYFGAFIRLLITKSISVSLEGRSTEAIQQFQEHGFFLILFYNNYFVPNIVGCFIVAVLFHRKEIIIKHLGEPLYTGGYIYLHLVNSNIVDFGIQSTAFVFTYSTFLCIIIFFTTNVLEEQ